MALSLFQHASVSIPAYKRMIIRAHIAARKIQTMQDFSRVPPISKDSYLRTSSLTDLCWDGDLATKQLTISATSGSTGEPFYFPRTKEQDLQYAAVAEMYLLTNFKIHERKTLYIIGWGMGVWIGGVFSYAAVRIVAERGTYPLSVITCGPSQDEILKAVKHLGANYDQVIIGGYPPMIKDLVDEGNRRHIGWVDYHVKFIFSAEGFSEEFRDYVCEHTGIQNPFTDTLNHYGTVDLGTMAHETPVSILIRRLAQTNPRINEALFGHPHRQPTLAQYIPELFFFEEVNAGLLCTGHSGLPLVRYDLLDSGGVKTLREVTKIFSDFGIDLLHELDRKKLGDTLYNLPFVYVFERSDFTVKFFGANIYPQEIRRALEHKTLVSSVTGKCTMSADWNTQMDQTLTINVELQPQIPIDTTLLKEIETRVIEELSAHNSEYANNMKNMGRGRLTPIIACHSYQSAPFFAVSGKHKWVRKTSG